MKCLRVETLYGVVVGIGLLLTAAPAAADNTIVVNTGAITGAVVELELPDGSVESFDDSDNDGVVIAVTSGGDGDHKITITAGDDSETVVLALGGSDIINVFFRPSAPEGRRIEIQLVFQGKEIVVTANKREQQLQEIPLSVGLVTADFVERQVATEFVDVAGSVPGVQFQTAGGGENRVTVRGISSGVGVATVGYYLDEISTTNGTYQGVPDFNLFDVERVEILRGPQGTLYGEGSMGGTVRFISNKPDPTAFDVAVDLRGGSITEGGNEYNLNAMVNIPLVTDKLALRVTGYKRDRDGWIDNIVLDEEDVNTEETEGVRAALRWDATDNFVVTASVFYNKLHTEGSDWQQLDEGQIFPTIDSFDRDYTTFGLTIDWDLGFASLVSATSYYDSGSEFDQGIPGFEPLIDFFYGFEPGTTEAVFQVGFNNTETLAQEFRLVSNGDGKLQWIAGLYYRDMSRFVSAGIATVPPIPEGYPPVFEAAFDENFEQMAAFGELTYFFTDSFQATAGLRLFEEELTWGSATTGILATDPDFEDSQTLSKAAPKLILAYLPADNVTLYATWSQAFRSGGFNLSAQMFPEAPDRYAPDETINYELGAKTGWFNNRLIANTAFYYIDWQDMQEIIAGAGALFGFVDNVGTAVSKGIELELVAYPVAGLELAGGGSVIDAEITESSGAVSEGVRLIGVPKHQYNLSADYTFALGSALSGTIRASWNKIGNRYFSVMNEPVSLVDGYDLVNARIGVQARSWQAYLYGTNLADSSAVLAWDSFFGEARAQPRTIGVNFIWKLK